MKRAPRCKCGCKLPTAGGDYLPGHNSKAGKHWSKSESRDAALLHAIEKRRAFAYRLLEEGRFTRDFDESYFRLFHRVQECHPDAELEVIVKAGTSYRAIDVGIPALKLGWEWAPGHRYHSGTVQFSLREQLLNAEGWRLVLCKTVPDRAEIHVEIESRKGEIAALTKP